MIPFLVDFLFINIYSLIEHSINRPTMQGGFDYVTYAFTGCFFFAWLNWVSFCFHQKNLKERVEP